MYRDQFPSIGEAVDDLEYIKLLSRDERDPNSIYTEYEWKAIPPLPAALRDRISPDMLTWVDRATWNEAEHICNWEIVTRYFGDRLQCHGQTTFTGAMGGRGCRLLFEGRMDWGKLPPSEALLMPMVEPFLKEMILHNFRKVSHVVERLIGEA